MFSAEYYHALASLKQNMAIYHEETPQLFVTLELHLKLHPHALGSVQEITSNQYP